MLLAEVLFTPTGMSKGCAIVEYSSSEEAQTAIRELTEKSLQGRPVFVREDREAEIQAARPPHHKKLAASSGAGAGGGGAAQSGGFARPNTVTNSNQLFVGNMPFQAGWQDLKDLFRTVGNVVRADINIGVDGRPKGSGTVLFENVKDAQAAIDTYNGYEWYSRILEVREDRFAGLSGQGTMRGAMRSRGTPRGGTRGGFRGGGGFHGPSSDRPERAERAERPEVPGQQVMIRNLPWATTNDDLIELCQTTGTVEEAEILMDGSRSRGVGVVQFAKQDEAESAISKFNGYQYGGRPLDVRFNDRVHAFASSKGVSAMET